MSKPFAPRRLYTPRTSRTLAPRLDPEAVGRTTESIARFFGTGRYLLVQTLLVLTWIVLNLFAVGLRWDPYPFILLNLAFSTQASYAAPLILLAQNRQEKRDRAVFEEDRRRAAQTKADTEYNARELAALRLAIGRSPRATTCATNWTACALCWRSCSRRIRMWRSRGWPTRRSSTPRNRGDYRVGHCATPVTRVMYGDLVHETKKEAKKT